MLVIGLIKCPCVDGQALSRFYILKIFPKLKTVVAVKRIVVGIDS